MNVLVVNNLKAGIGDSGLYAYVRELLDRKCEVTIRGLEPGAHLDSVLRDAAHFDRVVAAGGDGTASAVSYALRGSGVPIVVYPAGTGNILALNLKMPLAPADLARVTLTGIPLKTDMGEISCTTSNGTPLVTGFVNGAGAGFDAKIMEGAADLKPLIGAAAYLVSAMQNLAPTVSRFELELDGERVDTEGIAVIAVNFGKIFFDLALIHDGSAHDGQLDVIVLRSKNVAGLAPAAWALLLDRIGDHPDRSRSLEIHRASHMKVTADPPLSLQYDGDTLDATTPLEARVLPDAANYIVPMEYLPNEPG